MGLDNVGVRVSSCKFTTHNNPTLAWGIRFEVYWRHVIEKESQNVQVQIFSKIPCHRK